MSTFFSPFNPRITDWRGRAVWIIGASSGIGLALAERLHALGAKVVVSARSADKLTAFTAAHAGSFALPFDVSDAAVWPDAAKMAMAAGPKGQLDMVVYCAASYQAMRATAIGLDVALQHQRVNVEGAWHALAAVVPQLLRQGQGHISLVASVAGFRGLPQSLAYGPTKAALINLAETLYMDLTPRGIGVSVVNPGFVDTPLTSNNAFPMPALLSPAQAAQAMIDGWGKGLFEIHFPKRFTLWLKLLRVLPYRLYFPMVKKLTGL